MQPLLQKYALGNVSLLIHQMIAVDVELQINHFVRSWSNRYLKQGQGTDSRRSSLETRIDYDRVHCQMTLASLLQHHSRWWKRPRHWSAMRRREARNIVEFPSVAQREKGASKKRRKGWKSAIRNDAIHNFYEIHSCLHLSIPADTIWSCDSYFKKKARCETNREQEFTHVKKMAKILVWNVFYIVRVQVLSCSCFLNKFACKMSQRNDYHKDRKRIGPLHELEGSHIAEVDDIVTPTA